MSNRITVLKVLEIFWLILGCIAIVGFCYKAMTEGYKTNNNYLLLFIGIIGLLMFFLRRKKRKFLEEESRKQQNN